MGRYCFFTTGVEYKFAFGVQESSDILKFGGTPTFSYSDNHKHEWSIKDRQRIESTVRDLEQALNLPAISFDSYKKNNEGTYQLLNAIREKEASEPLIYTYMLGCIIYHQLLYKLDLSCTYEG